MSSFAQRSFKAGIAFPLLSGKPFKSQQFLRFRLNDREGFSILAGRNLSTIWAAGQPHPAFHVPKPVKTNVGRAVLPGHAGCRLYDSGT